MGRIPGVRALLRLPRSRAGVAREVGEEIGFHLEERVRALVGEGLTPTDARARALLEFGDVAEASAELEEIDRRRVRRVNRSSWWRDLRQDVRYGTRALARSPAFTIAAVSTLALGVGANTAIFGILHAALLRPLPFAEPERLMSVSLTAEGNGGVLPPSDDMNWSYPKFETFRSEQRVFADLALHTPETVTLEHLDEAPERISSEIVGATYFRTLGIAPALGRDFAAEEDTVPGTQVAILSSDLWSRRFNRDRRIVGQTVTIDDRSFLVVGVMPGGFRGLSGSAELWTPVMSVPPADFADLARAWSHRFDLVGRLSPGVGSERAESEARTLGGRIAEAHPAPFAAGETGAVARPLNRERVDPAMRRAVLTLFFAVSLLLLIACVNVANLLLARSASRTREVAIRLAIGASRWRLVRQLLTESMLLALAGGVAGVLLAWAGLRFMATVDLAASTGFGRALPGLSIVVLSSIRIDGAVLLFTAAIATVAVALFGVAPAWRASRIVLAKTLRTGEESVRAPGRARGFTGRGLLASGEIALALILLIATGLTLRSLGNLVASRIGFDPEQLLTVRFSLPEEEGGSGSAPPVLDQLLESVGALPGVAAVAVGNCPPLSGDCNDTGISFPDRPAVPRGQEPIVGVHSITPDYLQALRVPLLVGRPLEHTDRRDGPRVVLINEAAARAFWPNENPLGKTIGVGCCGFSDGAEVVGIIGDVRFGTIDELPRPDVYIPLSQSPRSSGIMYVRTATATAPAEVRRALREVAPRITLWEMKWMEERVGDAVARPRFLAMLLSIFGGIALALTAIGIYGVISFEVTQRTRELGIRMALGAGRGRVLRLVLGRGAAVTLAGIVVGLIGGLSAGRILAAGLHGVRPTDPLTLTLVVAGVATVGMVATLLPALRATRVDPIAAIRQG